MAGGSEKKRVKQNEEVVQQFTVLALGGIPLHALIRIWYYAESMSYFTWVGSCASMGVTFVSWWMLRSSAAKGADLMMQGSMLEYFKDLGYIGFAAMMGSIFSDYFFLLWILPIAYAAYKAGSALLAYLMPPPDAPPDAAALKRMAKKERQQEMRDRRSKGK
eukprot:gene15541-6436_t